MTPPTTAAPTDSLTTPAQPYALARTRGDGVRSGMRFSAMLGEASLSRPPSVRATVAAGLDPLAAAGGRGGGRDSGAGGAQGMRSAAQGSRGSSAGAGGPASDGRARPLTIHALNEQLLTAGPKGDRGATAPEGPSPDAASTNEPATARDGAAQARSAAGAQSTAERQPSTAAASPVPNSRPAPSPSPVASATPQSRAMSPAAQAGQSAAGNANSAAPTALGTHSTQPPTPIAASATAVTSVQPAAARPTGAGASPAAPPPPVGAPGASGPARPSAPAAAPKAPVAPVPSHSDDESPFAAQIARGVASAMAQRPDAAGQGSVVLRVQPEHLGFVRIHVGVHEQTVTARFEAATPEARDLLGRSLATLRSSLEARGLNVEHLHVNLAVPTEAAAGSHAGAMGGNDQRESSNDQPAAWNAAQHSDGGGTLGGDAAAHDGSARHGGQAEREMGGAVGAASLVERGGASGGEGGSAESDIGSARLRSGGVPRRPDRLSGDSLTHPGIDTLA